MDFNLEDFIQKLNEAAKSSIDELFDLWDFNGSQLLKALQIDADPEYCLDGVHEYYAKYSQSNSCEAVVNEIADIIDRNDTKNFTFDIQDKQKLLMIIVQGHNYGESIRLIRSGEDEYKGCISSNDGVYHFLYNQ
jgi:hypothetical protein